MYLGSNTKADTELTTQRCPDCKRNSAGFGLYQRNPIDGGIRLKNQIVRTFAFTCRACGYIRHVRAGNTTNVPGPLGLRLAVPTRAKPDLMDVFGTDLPKMGEMLVREDL